MSLVGTIQSLFQDKERTKPIFPVTKVKAVSDDNGTGLEALLEDIHTDIDAKAPAGYGLGGYTERVNITNSSELDSIVNDGWYGINCSNKLTVGTYSWQHFTMFVSSYNADHTHQEIRICGKDFTLCRDKTNRVWGEWEWVNPPMVLGVEYRTTKRHNGKPVYTKLIKHTFTATTGNVNGVTTFAINGGCSVVADIVSLSAVFVGYNGDKYIVPTMGGNGNVWLGVNRVASGNLYTIFVIVNDVFSTGSHGEVIYEYTKTTD